MKQNWEIIVNFEFNQETSRHIESRKGIITVSISAYA
ncbi:hypothetical protein SAMN05421740_101625 [Parapedobacter koreensis]|uniref:Uncharacterized protein n=1 Tax=Parapedobacter koreensis TaxID=332977 RepID=A0A1H7GDT9_9SPHI|nr:hypothetical protein SAMN05421740_101625 [Parapedobacter koreensis]